MLVDEGLGRIKGRTSRMASETVLALNIWVQLET
jgi:hypothetical protein